MQQGAQVNTSINTAGTGRLRLNLARLLRSPAFYPFVGLVVVTLVMILASDTFLTASNLSNIARQVSINAIIAVGMTCVILTGGIDVGAKAQIYALMRSLTDQGYAIIMISSELPEVIGMCDRVAVFHKGAIVKVLEASAVNPQEVMRHATGGSSEYVH